ncbi:unnamed protein product [Rangifer tarandus platyrhynchus]|uniref:Uncharacterized protein n=2 Tax=Rangifer tarandus platyrhynchus TaxID=3082113 RepID=A0ABN8YMI7_RANTA|nr:unnamed protein product [Rangifer tarandus platyrhynchus]CAI9698765.1 unnamed protein product [Rangifer tarandus platyrhynchus]
MRNGEETAALLNSQWGLSQVRACACPAPAALPKPPQRFTTDERTPASPHSDAVALRCLWSSEKTHSSCLCPAPVTLLVRTRLLHAPGRAHTEVTPTVSGLSEVPT